MNLELQRTRSRLMFVFLLICIGMAGLLARLYYWQVVQANQLSQLANSEHIQNQIVNAPRGLIYDSQGHILATNVVRDDVYIEPIQFFVDHPDDGDAALATMVSTLHGILPTLSEDSLTRDFKSGRQTLRIAGPIDPARSERLRALHLPDIFLEPRTWRIYPSANLVAQVLGFVQNGTTGVYGIEGAYNQLLAGKPGSLTAETDLDGNPLTVGPSSARPAVNGASLTLTIDSTIQYIAQSALAASITQLQAQGGAVVVLNAHTGAVVAMAGMPTFDPNHYSSYYQQMGCLDTESVYFNPALMCAYEPGSMMKSVTMAAALDQGLITPNTAFDDPGIIAFKDGTPPVTNWNDLGYGRETMTQVLEHSANVGAAYVAHDILGPNRYYPYLQRFGFGQLTGINDGPEEAGMYRTPDSPNWTPSDLARQAFGQSILATPLQVAMAYQVIANGGVMMRPYLVAAINNNGRVTTMQPQVERRVISARAAALLTQMLVSAANYNQNATFPGYSIAVKTGTATTQGISAYLTEASMAGFVPATNPQFVILVKLDRPQAHGDIFGGIAAGPLWRTIAEQLMWHYGIAPDQP